jgi:transposase
MAANLRRYELSDDEWARIKAYFDDKRTTKVGRPRSDLRTMLNGIIWIARSGAPWRDMPERYGKFTTVYGWFKRWQEEGIIAHILKDLGCEADMQDVGMDSTCAKVHQHAAGAKKGDPDSANHQEIGASRGGKNTKIHAVVDALGYPIHLHLSEGNIHDSQEAQECLESIDLEGTIVMADKAYGSKEIRESIQAGGGTVCIPPKSNEKKPWPCDYVQYKERHLVENFFEKLKQYRGIATRYAKLARRFLAFVQLASIRIWLA